MKIRIAVGAVMFCLFVTVTSVVTAALILNSRNRATNPTDMAGNTLSPAPNAPSALTVAEVARHNTPSDCWIIIDSKVYGVTPFLDSHPGGSAVMSPYCGRDATQTFLTKDQKPARKHSQAAYNLLPQYLIGTLGEPAKITQSGSVSSLVAAGPVATPSLAPSSAPATSNVTLTATETAYHNTASDCWLIISGNVYNVTSYLAQHPGGEAILSAYCGRDATTAFATRGGRGSNHSGSAYNLLSNFLIGSLGSSVTQNTKSGSGSGSGNPAATPVPRSGGSGGSLPAGVASKYPGATIRSNSIEDNGSMELKIIYNGACRQIKTNSSGQITQDEPC